MFIFIIINISVGEVAHNAPEGRNQDTLFSFQ